MLNRLLNSIGLYTKSQYEEQAECLTETNYKLMEMTHQCKLTTESVRELNQRCTSLSKQLNEANIVTRETECINENLTAENDELHMSLNRSSASNSALQKTIAELKEQKVVLVNHINDLRSDIRTLKNALEQQGVDTSESRPFSEMQKAYDNFMDAIDDMNKPIKKPSKKKKTDGKQ